jgi:hypothetical protein
MLPLTASSAPASRHPPSIRRTGPGGFTGSVRRDGAGLQTAVPDRRRGGRLRCHGLSVFERLRRKHDLALSFFTPSTSWSLTAWTSAASRSTRKATLASLLRGSGPGLRLNEHFEHSAEVIYRHACKMGLEGIVSRYVSGRTAIGSSSSQRGGARRIGGGDASVFSVKRRTHKEAINEIDRLPTDLTQTGLMRHWQSSKRSL